VDTFVKGWQKHGIRVMRPEKQSLRKMGRHEVFGYTKVKECSIQIDIGGTPAPYARGGRWPDEMRSDLRLQNVLKFSMWQSAENLQVPAKQVFSKLQKLRKNLSIIQRLIADAINNHDKDSKFEKDGQVFLNIDKNEKRYVKALMSYFKAIKMFQDHLPELVHKPYYKDFAEEDFERVRRIVPEFIRERKYMDSSLLVTAIC